MSVLLLAGLSLPAPAQEKVAPGKDKPALDPQRQAMVEAMGKFGTPGPEHKILLDGGGTGEVESKMWMDPAAPPTVSKGKSVQRALLG